MFCCTQVTRGRQSFLEGSLTQSAFIGRKAADMNDSTLDQQQPGATGTKAPPEFVQDDSGRTLFYPNGLSRCGYVVPDQKSQAALRKSVEGYNRAIKRSIPVLIVPFALLARLLFTSYGLEALLGLIAAFVLLLSIGWLWNRQWYGPLLAGLEQVPPFAPKPARRYYRVLAGLIAVLGAIWIVIRLYDLRISGRSFAAGATGFYSDITAPVIGILFAGLLSLGLIARPRLAPGSRGVRYQVFTVIVAAFAIGALGLTLWRFYRPTPDIVVTRAGIYCGWRALWRDIASIERTNGFRRRVYAHLDLAPALVKRSHLPPFARKGYVSCEIDGKTVDASDVFRAMYTLWQSNAGRRFLSPDDVTDLFPRGTLAADVVALLGMPRRLATAAGSVLYYPGLSPDDNAFHVAAFYLDRREQVTHTIRYALRNGHLIDESTGDALSDTGELTYLRRIVPINR